MTSRHRTSGWALVVVVLLGLAGCAPASPKVSNQVPPPASADPSPIVWAALGGDESLSGGDGTSETSWTTAVLDRLPPSAELLAVATPAGTLDDAIAAQLPALEAAPRPPTVATVWFGTGERATSTERFRDQLTELVQRLRDAGVARVVLVSRPDTLTELGGRYAPTIAEVAAATGAVHVAITGLRGSPRDPNGRALVAAAITPAILGG